MKITKRIVLFFLCFALLFTVGGEVFLSAFPVSAATEAYSGVLDDLQKDVSFDPSAYPDKPDDYSLDVIQVAEGENGELFLYVYQPSNATKDFKAKLINMSLQPKTDRFPTYKFYSLTWLNSNGVFDKYVVNDFTVSRDQYRYYSIAAVYRSFDEAIDDEVETIYSKQYKSFVVGKTWCAYFYNDTLIYEMESLNVVEIEVQASGVVRYNNGFKLYIDQCDSHFVAFSVENFDVDKIYDADITYTYRKVWHTVSIVGESTSYEDPITVEKEKLTDKDTGSNDGDGLLGVKYSWNRIQTAESFIEQALEDSNEGLKAEYLEALKKSDFVFQFLETDYEMNFGGGITYEVKYETTDVGVLRLHFLSQGKTYNLGVVGDLVGTGGDPVYEVTIGDNFENQGWWQKIIMVLGLIAIGFVLILLNIYCKPVVDAVLIAIKWFFKVLLSLLLLPFRLLSRKK